MAINVQDLLDAISQNLSYLDFKVMAQIFHGEYYYVDIILRQHFIKKLVGACVSRLNE